LPISIKSEYFYFTFLLTVLYNKVNVNFLTKSLVTGQATKEKCKHICKVKLILRG